MTAIEDGQDGKPRYYAPEHGKVIDNEDPEGLHRVKVAIPGLIEETDWAFPFGTQGGSAGRGGWRVPDVGADVVVWFIGGDVERPIYTAGWWGKLEDGTDERPTEVAAVEDPKEAHKVATVWEGSRLKIWVDEREGKEQLGIQDKNDAGDDGTFLQIDMTTGTITLQAGGAGLILKSIGMVQIQGAQVTINDRLIDASDKPI